jgi:hypothetical protein
MGQTSLTLLFIHRAGLDEEAVHGFSPWIIVGINIIGQPVLQVPFDQFGMCLDIPGKGRK